MGFLLLLVIRIIIFAPLLLLLVIVPLWTLRDVVTRFLALVAGSLLVVIGRSFIP